MIDFISGCAGLFSDTFTAACGVGIFRFLAGVILVETGFGLFFRFHYGMRKA